MVLQREMPIPVWGWAKPNEKVTVRLGKSSVSATAGANGQWSIKLPKMPAGGPYQLTVAGVNTLILSNVMIGEVWLCSGQSNMEKPIGIHPGQNPCPNYEKEIAAADYPQTRLMEVSPENPRTPGDDSRWNKIDGNNHSLLDARGHISAYGQTGQEPSLIMINYGTNDDRSRKSNPIVAASITQCLAALRASAPDAQIILLIPFGQYCAKDLKDAVDARKKARPADAKIAVIDLGPEVARNLDHFEPNGLMGGLHPNDRGHANFAAAIIPQMIKLIETRF